jgi:hypothetical protein
MTVLLPRGTLEFRVKGRRLKSTISPTTSPQRFLALAVKPTRTADLILFVRMLSLAVFHALRVTNRILILVDIIRATFYAAIQFVA